MDPSLRIFTLGGLSIRLGERRIEFSTRKAEALLVYLTTLQRAQPRETLATLLWEEQSQSQALTGLRAALVSLRKELRPYILATRTTIEIKGDNTWLDVRELEEYFREGEFERAVGLFNGEFLEGFYIKGSPGFENWMTGERERIRQLVQNGLHEIVSSSLQSGEFDIGIQYARQLFGIDPLDEVAHRKMMTLLARSGQRTAALSFYEECRQLLWEELGIEPETASSSLYEEIKMGTIDQSSKTVFLEIPSQSPPPAFLEDHLDRINYTPVVAREHEIRQLNNYLNKAIHYQGRVVFVTGNAGQGKTTLINEFIHQAIRESQDLLIASGYCSDFAGIGDPYLPFRDVMSMITGDVESRWASGAISREHALRLWNTLPLAIQALLDYGSNLIELLVPGADLISRASVSGFYSLEALEELKQRIEQQKTNREQLEQSYVFEQITNVLRRLSKSQPILITLDDFQWADLASISFLFHLGRRITDSRILVICSYRPDEISMKKDEMPHPLEKVLIEFKRLFGESWVELNDTQEDERRMFVDTLLDSEPNELGEEFRKTLFEHTGGQPLFTVELLRAMQERGDLIQKGGKWHEGKTLNWQVLPARVEAVIEERIARLGAGLKELLTVASVEGEAFTAQVIASIQETEIRPLIRRLSQELIKLHQLVKQTSSDQIGELRLFRYKFRHILFQKHFYERLEPIEREVLHLEVAATLEKIYGAKSGDIAPQLAFHYHQANNLARARDYYFKAGENAQGKYANRDAIEFFSQALTLTNEEDTHSRLDILIAREQIYSLQGNRDAQLGDLKYLEKIVQESNDGARKVDVALRRASYAELTSNYAESVEASSQAIEFARQIGDHEREASGQIALGLAFVRQGEYEKAFPHLTSGLETAQRLELQPLAGESLTRLGLLRQGQGNPYEAIAYYEKALVIYQSLGNRLQEAYVLNSIGNNVFDLWNYNEALDKYTQALSIFRQVGNQLGQGYVLNNLGLVSASIGNFTAAKAYYEDALAIFQAIDHPMGEGATLYNVGETCWFLEDYKTGRDYHNKALEIFQQIGSRNFETYGLTGLGNTSLGLGDLEAAENYYQQAIVIDHELGNLAHTMEARAGLARIAQLQAGLDRSLMKNAVQNALEVIDFLEQGNKLVTGLSTFWIFLTCYEVLRESQNSGAEKVLKIGHQQLMEWIDQITDPATQKFLLEKIPWIQKLVRAFDSLSS